MNMQPTIPAIKRYPIKYCVLLLSIKSVKQKVRLINNKVKVSVTTSRLLISLSSNGSRCRTMQAANKVRTTINASCNYTCWYRNRLITMKMILLTMKKLMYTKENLSSFFKPSYAAPYFFSNSSSSNFSNQCQ